MPIVRVFSGSVASDTKIDLLASLASSGSVLGMDCRVVSEQRYTPCDVAVIWGQSKTARRFGGTDLAEHVFRSEVISRHAGPVVIIDAPLMGRKVQAHRRRPWLFRKLVPRRAAWAQRLFPFWHSMNEVFGEYRVGLGGALGDNGGLALAPFAQGRYQLLARRLQLPPLQPYRRNGQNVIVMGQVPGDAALRGLDIDEWIVNTSTRLRQLTDRPVRVRLHPGAGTPDPKLIAALQVIGVAVEEPSRSFANSCQDAWAVVTYCSGAAIDALMAGVPAIATSSASFAWDVTDHDLACVVSPTEFPREEWLERLAAA